jgi:hypothetical protein
VLLAACSSDLASVGATRGFQQDYSLARGALEKQDYKSAIRRYEKLMAKSGPLDSRLRLELAHAYLRADDYAAASKHAASVAASNEGTARAAALAVKATANHRLAEVAMANGQVGPQTIQQLQSAKSDFDEVLSTDAELDPLGAMAERRRMVDAALKQVGTG